MRCSNCQNEVPDGWVYCPVCQAPVNQAPVNEAPVSQAPVSQAPMREGATAACPNCGYPPANPNSTICPYCHTPLAAHQQHVPPTWPVGQDAGQDEWEPAGPIDIFGDGWQPQQEQPQEEPQQQPEQPQEQPSQSREPRPLTSEIPWDLPQPHLKPMEQASEPQQAQGQSEAPFAPEQQPVPAAFELRPMMSPIMPAMGQGIAFEGETVSLSAQNLPSPMMDPQCQAVVARDAEGNWTIDNGSQNQSTYMLVNRPMALRDGDVILLGGNLYVFHPNEQL